MTAIRPATGYYRARTTSPPRSPFDDGSVATLTYTALGSKDHPKERLEIFVDGKVIALDDYKSLTVAGGETAALRTRLPEKGQKEELEAFVRRDPRRRRHGRFRSGSRSRPPGSRSTSRAR